MSQKRTHSLLESIANTAISFVISAVAWELVVKPVWGIQTTLAENFQITAFFTVLSIARGYVMRRIGNRVSVATAAAPASGAEPAAAVEPAANGNPRPLRPWPGIPYAHYAPVLDPDAVLYRKRSHVPPRPLPPVPQPAWTREVQAGPLDLYTLRDDKLHLEPVKPRLRKRATLFGVWWECGGAGLTVAGSTPQQAWQKWFQQPSWEWNR